MTTTQLTATQHAILAHAIHHTDGSSTGSPKTSKAAHARRSSTDFSIAH